MAAVAAEKTAREQQRQQGVTPPRVPPTAPGYRILPHCAVPSPHPGAGWKAPNSPQVSPTLLTQLYPLPQQMDKSLNFCSNITCSKPILTSGPPLPAVTLSCSGAEPQEAQEEERKQRNTPGIQGTNLLHLSPTQAGLTHNTWAADSSSITWPSITLKNRSINPSISC